MAARKHTGETPGPSGTVDEAELALLALAEADILKSRDCRLYHIPGRNSDTTS